MTFGTNRFIQVSLLALSLAAPVHGSPISEADIVNNWTSGHGAITSAVYGVDLNSATWSQSAGIVSGGGNRDGSLLSDFSSSGDFSFSTRIRASGDDDLFGILFGAQNYNNNYSLTFGGGGVSGINGLQLRRNDGTSTSTILASQSGNWVSGIIYDFMASRSGNDIVVSVLDGASSLFSVTVTDTTYTSGRIGFDIYSQSTEFSFGSTDFTSVPAPAPLGLLGLGLFGIAFHRKRARDWLDLES